MLPVACALSEFQNCLMTCSFSCLKTLILPWILLVSPEISSIKYKKVMYVVVHLGLIFLLNLRIDIFSVFLACQVGFQAIAEALGLAAVKAAVAISAIIAGGRLVRIMLALILALCISGIIQN